MDVAAHINSPFTRDEEALELSAVRDLKASRARSHTNGERFRSRAQRSC